MRIRVQGDNVQTWLNGEEMVNIRDEKIEPVKGVSLCKYMMVAASRFFGATFIYKHYRISFS